LRAAFTDVQQDAAVRSAILTGAGEKAFVAGADINELARQDAVSGKAFAVRGQSVLDLIENLGKPVIACINGFALGGGCEIAMACTMRLASENARLGQPEVKLGIIPGYGGTQRLPRLVGTGLAMQILLTGEMITAHEAHRIGLVNEVVPADRLISRAEEIAQKIIGMAPLAIQYCMEAVNQGMNMTLPEGLFLEATAQVFRGDSENVFAAPRRSNVSAVGHLRAYSDLSESTNIDFGFSYARGHSPFGEGHNQLYGGDFTLRWKPLRRAIYHSFVGRSEFIWARTTADDRVVKPFGYYASADYQFARRWFLGGRFDRSQRGQCLPTNPVTIVDACPAGGGFLPAGSLIRDTGGSAILTYWPSEFAQIRTQLRRTRYGEGLTANEILFQLQFSMGAHGAHPF
jgi:enoyl-CoA hydratase